MGPKVLWAITIGCTAGILLRSLLPLGLAFTGFLALLGVAALLVGCIERQRLRASMLLAITLFSLAAGILRMHSAVVSVDPVFAERIGSKIMLEGVVANEPDQRGRPRRCARACRCCLRRPCTR